CDFLLYHPELYRECLVIESKWQQTPGSVDEKFPYLSMNIKEKFPYKAIVVADGDGYKEGAIKWIRNQVGDKLLGVFNMKEFQTWSNKGKL
ncbi:DNA adenine methylase, partial [bacterium]|nr:DNA adenine methylase [bacterium]